jgi:hypothetical protein
MSQSDRPIFFAQARKSGWDTTWIISTQLNSFQTTDPAYRAQLTQNRSASRFALRPVESNQDTLGIGFFTEGMKSQFRAFRAVMPKSGQYEPPNNNASISRLAKKGQADAAQFVVWESKIPQKGAAGGFVLNFGEVFVLTSLKNFVVEDSNGEVIFMSYKSSEATCSVKIREPITPLIGFALAIAVVIGET